MEIKVFSWENLFIIKQFDSYLELAGCMHRLLRGQLSGISDIRWAKSVFSYCKAVIKQIQLKPIQIVISNTAKNIVKRQTAAVRKHALSYEQFWVLLCNSFYFSVCCFYVWPKMLFFFFFFSTKNQFTFLPITGVISLQYKNMCVWMLHWVRISKKSVKNFWRFKIIKLPLALFLVV